MITVRRKGLSFRDKRRRGGRPCEFAVQDHHVAPHDRRSRAGGSHAENCSPARPCPPARSMDAPDRRNHFQSTAQERRWTPNDWSLQDRGRLASAVPLSTENRVDPHAQKRAEPHPDRSHAHLFVRGSSGAAREPCPPVAERRPASPYTWTLAATRPAGGRPFDRITIISAAAAAAAAAAASPTATSPRCFSPCITSPSGGTETRILFDVVNATSSAAIVREDTGSGRQGAALHRCCCCC
jgi:hypothetical protein